MSAIQTTMALGPGVDRRAVEEAFGDQPGVVIDEIIDAALPSLGYLESSETHALVIFCREGTPELLQFIHGVVAQRPDRPVIVHYGGLAHDFVRRAFDAGAEDLITGTVDSGVAVGPQISFALEKAVARRGGVAGSSGVGELRDASSGPRAAPARRCVGCNLGVASPPAAGRAIRRPRPPVRRHRPGLGLRPERTSTTWPPRGGTLDAEKIEAFLSRTSPASTSSWPRAGPTRRPRSRSRSSRAVSRRCARWLTWSSSTPRPASPPR